MNNGDSIQGWIKTIKRLKRHIRDAENMGKHNSAGDWIVSGKWFLRSDEILTELELYKPKGEDK